MLENLRILLPCYQNYRSTSTFYNDIYICWGFFYKIVLKIVNKNERNKVSIEISLRNEKF